MANQSGVVRIFAGEAEAESAAAYGFAMLRRAVGDGVAVVRFREPKASGELFSARELGIGVFLFTAGAPQESGEFIALDWRAVLDLVASGEHDLVVLDGLLDAVEDGAVPMAEVVGLLEGGAPSGLLLTGLRAPVELVKRADIVVEMLAIKR